MWILAGTIIETLAVAIWLWRRLWPHQPVWVVYGLAAVVQSWVFLFAGDPVSQSNVWNQFAPWMLALLVGVTLEFFWSLSRLYQRFERDRWKWLVGPVVAGAVCGFLLVSDKLNRQASYYRGMVLAEIWVGVVLSAILVFCWVAAIPVRMPANMRRHFTILVAYISTQAVAYYMLFDVAYRQFLTHVMDVVPAALMLIWAFVIDRNEGPEAAELDGSGPASLSEIKSDVRRIQRAAGQ